mgnify:CR=1 FL=1|tara:strand:+ start:3771 stop:5063 length:1293 start_codon:yes stop_codon:yes gene_type:complete
MKISILEFFTNSFFRNVTPLVRGSILSQSILILSTPIITRIYSPESYGLLTLYLALISIITIFINARYEQSIMLPERKNDAKNLFFLSILISCTFSVLIFALIIVIYYYYPNFNKTLLYMLVPAVFLTGILQPLGVWNNRLSEFNKIANVHVSQTSTTALVQIILGTFFQLKQFGLLLGPIAGLFIGIVIYIKTKIFRTGYYLKSINFSQIKKAAYEYREFPYYSIFGALTISIASQAPIFFIGASYETSYIGQYGLASRIVLIPIVLLSTAFFQVIFKHISLLAYKNFLTIRAFLINKLLLLGLIGIVPLTILSIWSEPLFMLFFGDDWALAGTYATYLSWVAYIKLCINPLMAIFNIKGLVKYGVYWQVLYSLTLTFFLVLIYWYETSIIMFIKFFVLHEIILNILCLVLIFYVTSKNGYNKWKTANS